MIIVNIVAIVKVAASNYKAAKYIVFSHRSSQLPVFDENLFTQAVALHFRLAPVFPAALARVSPHEGQSVFPAARVERRERSVLMWSAFLRWDSPKGGWDD